MRQLLSKQKMILKINLQKTLIQMADYLAKQHRPTLQVILLAMNRQTINFQESPMAMLNLKQHLKRVKQLQKFKVQPLPVRHQAMTLVVQHNLMKAEKLRNRL